MMVQSELGIYFIFVSYGWRTDLPCLTLQPSTCRKESQIYPRKSDIYIVTVGGSHITLG